MKSQKDLSSVITRSAVLLTEFWPILFRPVHVPSEVAMYIFRIRSAHNFIWGSRNSIPQWVFT